MENSLKNMILSLLVITLVCSTVVGLVYRVTQRPIDDAKTSKVNAAIGVVLPAFDGGRVELMRADTVDGHEFRVYTALKDGTAVGYAIETFTMRGFNGEIRLMVGFLPDGTIHRVETLSHSETPGFGDKINPGEPQSSFVAQFQGRNPADFNLSLIRDGGDVDAITGSTVTSRAFADALDRAHKIFQSVQNKGGA